MPNTEIDWTFDAIPAENEEPARRPRAPNAPRPGPPPRHSVRRRRLWLLAGAVRLVAVIAASVYLLYANGWRRVEAQLSQEIAYEDNEALAGQADTVAALQWPDNKAWINQRALEASLGWPARPPADDLLPLAQSGRLVEVDILTSDQVVATVLRTFADSAGRTYDFEYVQRYRSNGPGLWQRQAPLTADLQTTTLWSGQRLTVTLPVADEPWLAPLLPQIDAYLVRACADWQCPHNLDVPLTFTGRLEELPSLAPARRPAALPEGPRPYPITFDLIFRTPRYPRRVILPSLQLAGRPHNADAQAALVRSITTNLLAYVAAELAQSSRSGSGDYLDALIARAEIRLGLSPAPEWVAHPNNFQPPETLWPFSRIGEARGRRAGISARLQALAFLDFALAGSPPSADGALLQHIRFFPRLDDWLTSVLRVDGPAVVERWMTQTTSAFAAQAPPRWDELEGLAYVCDDAGWLVRGGQPVPLPIDDDRTWLPRFALSADGQYLAVVEATSSAISQIRVINLADQSSTVVASAGLGLPLGWTPGGDLLYITQEDGPFATDFAYELRLYHPGTEVILSLSAEPLVTPWGEEQSWTTDHSFMAITLVQQSGQGEEQLVVSPGLIALQPPLQVLRLPAEGYGAAIAPDGRYLAYFTGPRTVYGTGAGPTQIELMNTHTQVVYSLLPPAEDEGAWNDLNSLEWSPDGRQLAFLAYEPEAGTTLYTLTFAGADPSAGVDLQALATGLEQFSLTGFSADGRYLAGQQYDQDRSETIVYDLQTGQSESYLGGEASMPWSPRGHLLALAGPGGLYIVDPATGEEQWVTRGACRPSWFQLP